MGWAELTAPEVAVIIMGDGGRRMAPRILAVGGAL
jgi:hypothetical protein